MIGREVATKCRELIRSALFKRLYAYTANAARRLGLIKDKLGPRQRAWLNALRSGKYKQCKHYLNNANGFCCLGVLTDLASKDGVEVARRADGTIDGDVLSFEVKKWSGMAFINGESQNDKLPILTNLNDRDGCTFYQIADVIESHPEAYFIERK